MKKKKAIHSDIFQLKQDLLSSLGDRSMFAKKINDIKNSANYQAISVVSRDLCHLSPYYKRLIYGNLFPKSYNELGVCNPYFIRPESIENEIRWVIHQIQKHGNAILHFSKTRESVETKILLGNYDDALIELQQFQNECGVSIWCIEAHLIIYYLQNKTKKVLDFLTDINICQKDNKTGFVPYLSYMLYKRSNPKLSAYDYDEELKSYSKKKRGAFLTDRYNYFEFKLNYYNSFENENLSSVLLMDSTNALIDRYDSLIKIIIALFVSERFDREVLSSIAQKVYTISSDRRLLPIVSYANEVPAVFYDSSFMSILDHYYSGNYDQCIHDSKIYIQKRPSNIDVLKIICRSLLFQDKSYVNIVPNNDSVINKIGNLVYNLMKGEEVEKNIYPLFQIFKNLNGFSISAGLYCFINEERNRQYNRLINLFASCCFDPYGVYMYDNQQERLDYVDKAIEFFPSSRSLSYQRNRYGNIISDDDAIVAYIRKVDNARLLFNTAQYDDCIELLKQVKNDYSKHVPVVQTSVRYIFDSYVNKGDYTSGIAFYVNEYIKDESIVAKVDTNDLSRLLHRMKYKGIKYNLDLLIFMFVSQQTDTARSAVLERYCKYKEVDNLLDLLPLFSDEKKEKVEALVSSIVTGDVLRHTKLVGSTKQIMEVDNALLQYVLQNNPLRKEEFTQLNEELAAEMIVYSGMRKVDDSLIFANVPAIIKYELNDVEPLYEQFKAHFELSQGSTCYVIFSNADDEKDNKQKLLAQTVHYTDSSLFDTSSQLFKGIMYPFLKSKFGIGTYLSTRIRHGVFETNLQSVFIGQDLMLHMENGKFIPDIHWFHSYSLSSNERVKLFETLSKLSTEVNNIIQNFKSDVLQIRMTDKEKGGFDYRLSDEEICMSVIRACKNTNDFESFCYAMIKYLWEVTNKSLKNIRCLVSNDLKMKFNEILDVLTSETSGIGNDSMQNDLSTAINNARTDVNLHLNKIERWFYLQDCKFEDFSFETHLRIVWNLICETHPSIDCELHCNKDLPTTLMSGEYGIHLSDLLHIFFANMINHSKKEKKRHFILNAKQVNNQLQLHFENDFEGNEEYVNQKIGKLLNSYERLQKEGGSGLVKARKIVKYDLGDINNEVIMVVKNGKCKADITINMDKLCVKTGC